MPYGRVMSAAPSEGATCAVTHSGPLVDHQPHAAIVGEQVHEAKGDGYVNHADLCYRRKENAMRAMFRTAITVGFAMVFIGMSFASRANA
jgi:hypothetical protein